MFESDEHFTSKHCASFSLTLTLPYIRLHVASLLVQLPLTGFLIHYWPTRSSLAQLHWAPWTLLAYPAPLAHSDSTGLQWPNQNSLIFSNSTGFLSIHWLLGQYRPSLAPFGNTCLHWLSQTTLAYAGPFTPLVHSEDSGFHWPTHPWIMLTFAGPLRLH